MSVVVVNSAFSYNIPITTSRSTLTMTLPSGTSRKLVVFGAYGNPDNYNTPMSGNTTPTFGGVALSELTRPTGGTNVFQTMNWHIDISDGSSGDYPLVTVKQTVNASFEGIGVWLSNTSSVVSSIVSTNLTIGPMGLNQGNVIPSSAVSDMVLGFVANSSGATVPHTQTGEGVPVFSNITPGSNSAAIYTPTASLVTQQGDSSVSLQWTMGDSQRWRIHAAIVFPSVDGGGGGGGGGSGAGGWIQPSTVSLLSKDWVGAWSRGVV